MANHSHPENHEQEASEYIIGRNSVREALRAQTQIERVYIAKGTTDGSIRQLLAMARDARVVIREVPRSKLDELAMPFGYEGRPGNHQGIIAQVPAFQYSELEDVFALAEQRAQPPLIMVLDGIQDSQNLGAIIRSAEALGAHGVVIGKRRSVSLNSVVYKISSGAAGHIPVVKVTNINRTIEELKAKNVWAVAADLDGEEVSKANLKGAVAFIIGNEGEGVSRLTKELCDMTVSIPLGGQTQSLNAACAASIVLYEKTRQDRA